MLNVGRVSCRRSDWGFLARPMRKRQPLREKPRSFVWCRSVERHHRRWEARRAAQLRAPSVADGRHLDVVRPPANRFVEAKSLVQKRLVQKHCHVCRCPGKWSGLQFYAVAVRDQAKRVAKTVQQTRARSVFRGSAQKKILRVRFSTGFALSVHRFSTTSVRRPGRTQVKCCIA